VSRYLTAVVIIFCGASIGWLILGGTIFSRTTDSDENQRQKLSAQWGSAQTQLAPQVTAGHEIVPLRSSHVAVGLDLEQRRKGLLWYNLYNVQFSSHYIVRNDTRAHRLTLRFVFPSSDGSFMDFSCTIGGRQIANLTALSAGTLAFDLEPGRETPIDIRYASRGMDTWNYSFGKNVQPVRNFSLDMTTNFGAIDFPPQTLLPVSEERSGSGWQLHWRYSTLVSSSGIGMAFPYPLQPGPIAQRITFWAPVALLFYFFVMLTITILRKMELHPINYFFLAASFFAFHLLFAYLVDRIAIEVAFVICSLVSMFLTISYLRLAVGWRFAAVESGLAQLVYLILFSYALFNEGWSGLSITIGAVITLFLAMQFTGRIKWSERFNDAPATAG
jgi:hypothetical protein